MFIKLVFIINSNVFIISLRAGYFVFLQAQSKFIFYFIFIFKFNNNCEGCCCFPHPRKLEKKDTADLQYEVNEGCFAVKLPRRLNRVQVTSLPPHDRTQKDFEDIRDILLLSSSVISTQSNLIETYIKSVGLSKVNDVIDQSILFKKRINFTSMCEGDNERKVVKCVVFFGQLSEGCCSKIFGIYSLFLVPFNTKFCIFIRDTFTTADKNK